MVWSMYYRERPILVPLHTSVCLIDSSIIRKLCMVVWCLMVVAKAIWRQDRLHGRLVVNTCRICFKGSSSMSSHFTTTPASNRPGLPKPLPSVARASRLKRSPSLQNVNATFTGLNCRCSWCVTDMRARCPLGPHVSNPTHLQLSH